PGRPNNPHRPTACYNGMIAPLEPLAIKGAIWYQGESNVGGHAQYKRLLPALVADWRARFSGGEFPFYIVQLAAYQQTSAQPRESNWAAMCWTQMQIGEDMLENAGTAVIIDIGDHNDIHPRNKLDVGARLARLALNRAYGKKDVRDAGPVPLGAGLDGNKAVVSFKTEGTLQGRDGAKTVKGFALAGEDRKFVWAAATVNGKGIDVTADGVPAPRFVRYAWDDYPDCDLTDELKLPCGPFEFEVAR
ncbi:MAG: sialate O-acetylesterase, partial [Kiritimatiellaeota bacterium]|nr:sialate O-acetylesterase [Kiritimatiellota bacterium]